MNIEDQCSCFGNKKPSLVMSFIKGNFILPNDHIDYIQRLFSEHVGDYSTNVIHKR